MNTHQKIILAAMALALMLNPMPGSAIFGKDNPEKERKELQEARTNALNRLYEERPTAREELRAAKGYAVFSSIGVNLFLLSTERGGGILRDNTKGQDVYMRMFSAGSGIGWGVKDFALIFVFHTQSAMDQFQLEGWDFSGQADAGAESGDKGAGLEKAVTAMPGTSIYQLTDAGLSLQATLKGTKFWRSEELNKP
jgi:lipid-binding SYLF domain-containing protein